MPEITGAHHAAFTVSDAERSRRWYEDLLGMQCLFEGDEPDVSFRIMLHPGTGWVLGLRQYHDKADGAFDEFRTGLDHFAFGVASRDELEAWQAELEQRSIPFTPVADTPMGSVIVFRDPDNIQLEFFALPS
jgi:glyoxylase I family protein